MWRFVSLVLLLAAWTSAPSRADEAAQKNAAAAGWKVGEPVELFDGKSLDGWTTQDGRPVTQGWKVEDGLLTRHSRGGNIFYHRPVGDFELKFEWKIERGGNNGLKYRVRRYGGRMLGCEYQLLGETRPSFSKGSCGALYAIFAPNDKKRMNPPGEWNEARIVAHGPRIEHWMNGEKIVDVEVGSEAWQQRLSQSKFSPYRDFARNTVGRIMITDHGSKVWYRKLVLTPLPPREIPPAPEAYAVSPLTDELAAKYELDPAFYKKWARTHNILIAASDRVSDHAIRETAYQFDMIMTAIKPQIAQRIRDSNSLCLLIGHDELTSQLPQFATDKTGKELDFYNWRRRGFLAETAGRPTAVFAEEDVLEFEGGMQEESILVHEFCHLIHRAGFDDRLQKRLTEVFQRARGKGIWRDGRAAQRFRRVKSETPVSLRTALIESFPDQPPELLDKCLEAGDILVDGKPAGVDVKVDKDDEVLIVFGGPKDCYAYKNRAEYWAEVAQCWFDTNRTMDHDHNHIHTRGQLKAYDPAAAKLCQDVLRDGPWRFVSPRERAGEGHLKGFDPAQSPKVTDPEHIELAALDYYDKYWNPFWQRLHEKHGIEPALEPR